MTGGLGKYANKLYETLTGDFRKRAYDNPSVRRKYMKSNKVGDFAFFFILCKFSLIDHLKKFLLIKKISRCHVT